MSSNLDSLGCKAASLAFCLIFSLAGSGGGDETQVPPASDYRYDVDMVQTASGVVGADQESTAAMRILKAIPYAAPPVGTMRWRAPQPVRSWTGTRKTTDFAPACMQGQPTDFTSVAVHGLVRRERELPVSERWTAAASGTKRRPVMVFVRGGSNRQGRASNPTYDGSGLAGKGVVVVVTGQQASLPSPCPRSLVRFSGLSGLRGPRSSTRDLPLAADPWHATPWPPTAAAARPSDAPKAPCTVLPAEDRRHPPG